MRLADVKGAWLQAPGVEHAQLMRIFFSTDIHGSERCFMKFVNAAKAYRADALVMGGDITGKLLVPVVTEPDGTVTADVFGNVRSARDDAEAAGAWLTAAMRERNRVSDALRGAVDALARSRAPQVDPQEGDGR